MDKEQIDAPVDTCQIDGLQYILRGVLGDLPGTFVEVGAYDGLTWSNTYHLAQKGWYGTYVEPVAHLYERCVGNHKNHPNITVLNCAVGSKEVDSLPMYTDGQELYTLDKTMADELGAKLIYGTVHTRTLKDILHEVEYYNVDLLVVDVEGYELDVLKGHSFWLWRPKIIIIEAHNGHKRLGHLGQADVLQSYLGQLSYLRVYSDTINDIYVDRNLDQEV